MTWLDLLQHEPVFKQSIPHNFFPYYFVFIAFLCLSHQPLLLCSCWRLATVYITSQWFLLCLADHRGLQKDWHRRQRYLRPCGPCGRRGDCAAQFSDLKNFAERETSLSWWASRLGRHPCHSEGIEILRVCPFCVWPVHLSVN